MGEPLDGARLLAYVRARLHELDEEEQQVLDEAVDKRSLAFMAGLITGRASAYHDVEHVMNGWYGGNWEQQTDH
jgi:hypothetical protein